MSPLQLLRKGLECFPPVLEMLMSAGKVAGSRLWASEKVSEKDILQLSP